MVRPLIGCASPDQDTLREVGPIWAELHGGLWHTTHPERFLGIIEKQAILVEPEIPERDRWGTIGGHRTHPYVRFIGGLSLFDFTNFDPSEYRLRCAGSNWRTFVPYRVDWAGAIWLEIDRSRLSQKCFLSGPEVYARYDGEVGENRARNLMPYIEAAHLGDLPLSACKRALFVCWDKEDYWQFYVTPFDAQAYVQRLSEWQGALTHRLEHLAQSGGSSLASLVQRQAARQTLAALRRQSSGQK